MLRKTPVVAEQTFVRVASNVRIRKDENSGRGEQIWILKSFESELTDLVTINKRSDDVNKHRPENIRFYSKGKESYVKRLILLGRTEIRSVKNN